MHIYIGLYIYHVYNDQTHSKLDSHQTTNRLANRETISAHRLVHSRLTMSHFYYFPPTARIIVPTAIYIHENHKFRRISSRAVTAQLVEKPSDLNFPRRQFRIHISISLIFFIAQIHAQSN